MFIVAQYSSGGEVKTSDHEKEGLLDDNEQSLVSYLTIPGYIFDINDNPYAFSLDSPLPLKPIAEKLDQEILARFQSKNILIRAIQSGHYSMNREASLDSIINNGGDFHLNQASLAYAMSFMPWQKDSTILSNLEGFHKYKPKREERPQNPADIWMIFDAKCYKNIEYIHPRHKVITRDKWQVLDVNKTGLLRIIIN